MRSEPTDWRQVFFVNLFFVSEKIFVPAEQSERSTLSSRLSFLISGVLDSISFALFSLSFSGLMHAVGAVWYRFSNEE